MTADVVERWIVLKAVSWSALSFTASFGGRYLCAIGSMDPFGDSAGFLPVFKSRAEAEKWSAGRWTVEPIALERKDTLLLMDEAPNRLDLKDMDLEGDQE